MWFMFGFITLLCFVVAYIRRKIASNYWTGWSRYLDELKYSSSKSSTPFGKDTITIAIDAPSSFDFHLKNETWHDRLFKYIGLSSEAQIGEVDFDRSVYIVSDDAVFLNALKESGQVKNGLLALFNHNSECIVATDELRCTSKKLWISYKIHRSLSDEDISGIIKQTVPLLHEMKDALNQASTAQPKVTTRDPFIFRASLLLVISSGLFIAGIVHSARTGFNYVPFMLDPLTLLPMTLVIAVPILITLVIVAVKTLGKSSRAHLVYLRVRHELLSCSLSLMGKSKINRVDSFFAP